MVLFYFVVAFSNVEFHIDLIQVNLILMTIRIHNMYVLKLEGMMVYMNIMIFYISLS